MTSVQHLREFISERLTAAAEEIFSLFEKTIEEELEVQRRLLDISWKPQVRLSRIDLQQLVCKKEGGGCVEQQLWNQDSCSNLDLEEPEPLPVLEDQEEPEPLPVLEEPEPFWVLEDQEEPEPSQFKEEPKELCCSLETKQETETFMETSTDQEPDFGESEPNTDSQNSPVAVSTDQKGNTAPPVYQSIPCTQLILFRVNAAPSVPPAVSRPEADGALDKLPVLRRADADTSVKCDICDKMFANTYSLKRHHRLHSGERPYPCTICGREFIQSYHLTVHMRSHTGERPYSCGICGKAYSYKISLRDHMVTHTRESVVPVGMWKLFT